MNCVAVPNSDPTYKSIDKMQQYPIVNDSLVFVFGYYQWLKSTNKLIENALTKAENTIKTVKESTEPIAANKLRFIDHVLYNQLERLEKTCPIILQSSKTIADASSKVYRNNLESAVKTIFWPVTKTIKTVSKTSYFAISTVSSVVELSIDKVLPANYLVCIPTNYVIDKTDEFLDRFLPDYEESSHEELADSDLYSKVCRFSFRTQTRIYRQALRQIDLLQKSSLEKLERIQNLVSEVQNKRIGLKESILHEYFQAIESIKDNIPMIPVEHWNLMKEILHNSKELLKSLSVSSTLTIEFMVKNALEISISLNKNLLNLQNMLNKANPEFVSDSTLAYYTNVITLTRAWLEFFINFFKLINLIGVRPLMAIM